MVSMGQGKGSIERVLQGNTRRSRLWHECHSYYQVLSGLVRVVQGRSLLAWSVLLARRVPIGKPRLARYDIPVNMVVLSAVRPVTGLYTGLSYFR